ncbi:MAG: dethiobiotin synthase [Kofleriaceae bacterium]
MIGYFVTGTDTGVGKTFVTAALAREARALGVKVFAFKPVETGCSEVAGELRGDDQLVLAEAAGGWQTGRLLGLYQFRDPVAPLVASREAGTPIDIAAICSTARHTPAALTLVEGAGGWRVPITETVDMGGLAQRLGLPVILVARAGLGTINHSLLTAEAIARDGCSLAAIVLSCIPTDSLPFADSNVAEIKRHVGCPVMVHSQGHSLSMLL